MYVVKAEHMSASYETEYLTSKLESTRDIYLWMLERANPSCLSFYVPKGSGNDLGAVSLGVLPGGSCWLVHEIDQNGCVVYSDGALTGGKKHTAKAVQEIFDKLRRASVSPSSRFVEVGDDDPVALTITRGDLKSAKGRVGEMRAMYANEKRDDWFDADDLARDIAETFGALIEANGY